LEAARERDGRIVGELVRIVVVARVEREEAERAAAEVTAAHGRVILGGADSRHGRMEFDIAGSVHHVLDKVIAGLGGW
jgi:hypothetical protein